MILVSLLYSYAIITNNNIIGDLLSPVLMFVISGIIFYGFVKKQQIAIFKWFGVMLTLAAFSWLLCDIWWGVQTLVMHVNPEENFITVYGYSLSNLFLFLAMILALQEDFKKMSKIKAMLDTLIISTSIAVLLWLFVFEQSSDKVVLLLKDPISMASIISDVIIYGWINVWYFSIRITKPSFYQRILVTGAITFVITDFIYYYIYFYSDYKPNSWIDGLYMLSFSFMAVSAILKTKLKKEKSELILHQAKKRFGFKFSVELFALIVPIIVLIFKENEIEYFILLVMALLIYYILINFTQKSIFQEKLLELEKKNVLELEKKVKERTEEITKLHNTDYVTGLYNRRYFEDRLSRSLKGLQKDELISLLYIELNKSKSIKYLYGKDTAEKLLKSVSKALYEIVIKNGGFLAAYGDDTFAVKIKGYEAEAAAEKIAMEIIDRCNELFFVDNHGIKVTLNIGVSCYPRDTLDENSLIKNADAAMMQARDKGFNRVQSYSDKIGKITDNRHKIEVKLKKVVFDKEFLLYYQPQVYCKDGTLSGFEALIRWYEGGTNFIPPLDFIPLAEETGIIVPLGYWIIENAAKQYALWKEKTGHDYRIAVNVSSKQLVEVDFVEKLEAILKKYEVKPELFEVEITETQQIENSINIQETLCELKRLGVSIAIDDFGTGYSSLYYIKNLPADRIKIAKELIDNVESDFYSRAIIQMVISVANMKGNKVIAEGVETKEQWECLQKLYCDEIQGYYFAKPMPASDIEEKWISKENIVEKV
ncbi:putative bifunctional diguanylate cyclase/phosphodiesterase [Clostridium yunnanense]|uniref:putative bifunctional diguanylate cyclase/phosphodiesterase n=1 Tax=Clostridium yunnanense TaxID=2800325 RepID=UPI0019051DDE|nr:phosphodiesterase [Clostridium yunnanense]